LNDICDGLRNITIVGDHSVVKISSLQQLNRKVLAAGLKSNKIHHHLRESRSLFPAIRCD